MKKKILRRGCSLALIASVAGSAHFAAAEDIDLFVGAATSATAMRPNVLVIIDNSSNWSSASQHWVGEIGRAHV
jgi:hypothetical protein